MTDVLLIALLICIVVGVWAYLVWAAWLVFKDWP